MRYMVRYWSVENQKGNGVPLTVEDITGAYEYNRRDALSVLQAHRPDNRKKYKVHVYCAEDGTYVLKGTATIYNHHLTGFDLPE